MLLEEFSYLSAGLGGDLEGGLESPSLLSGQDGSWSLGPPGVFPVVPLPLAADAFLRLDVQLLIVALLCTERMKECDPTFHQPGGVLKLHN